VRYLAVYSYVTTSLGTPRTSVVMHGNVDITTDGPVSSLAAVRKVEATIARDFGLQQVVLVNLLQLAGAEPSALQPEVASHG
jgi:hypothetical protein